MRLNPPGSLTQPETPKPKKGIRWGKFFYLLALLLLAAAAIRFGIRHFSFIRAPGIIEGKKLSLAAPLSAKIEKMQLQIGDKVTAGQELIFLDTKDLQDKIKQQASEIKALKAACESEQKSLPILLEEKNNELKLKQNTVRQNHQRLTGEIKQLQLKSSQLNKNLAEQRQRLAKSRQLLKLNAITRSKLQDIRQKAQELENEIPAIKLQLQNRRLEQANIQQALKLIKENKSSLSRQVNGKSRLPFLKAKLAAATQQLTLLQAARKERVLCSPMTGTVTQIFKSPGELVMTGEAIAELVDPGSIRVKAFFDPKHQPQLTEGAVVNLVFDNQTVSQGKIHKLYPATTPLPPQFQQVYEPHKQALIAEVLPINRKEWPLTIGMGVRVQKPRW